MSDARETDVVRLPPMTIIVPRPQIHTGPKDMTVDAASAMYLRDAACRVRANRYWGSGVSALVARLLDDAAQAIDTTEEASDD